MGGVAEERDAAAAPLLDRRPGAQHPHAPAFDLVELRAHRLASFRKTLVQLGRVAVTVPAFLVTVGMEHGDQIEQFAGAQRIVHEMHLLAGPQHHVAPAILLRHFRRRQNGAIGDMAGGFRLPSPTTSCRMVDHSPSAPIKAAPRYSSPLSVRTVTPSPLSSTLTTFSEASSRIRSDFWQASSSTLCKSARWISA